MKKYFLIFFAIRAVLISIFVVLKITQMDHNYEDIVRNWYNRLRPAFLRRLTQQYPSLRLGDAENLYQDTFIAIYDNLLANRVRPDTSWNSYIMKIGLNLAKKAMRILGATDNIGSDDDDENCKNSTAHKVDLLLKSMPEDEISLSKVMYSDL